MPIIPAFNIFLEFTLLKPIGKNNKLNIDGTRHFYQLAAKAMRQILIDNARAKLAQKRNPQDAHESPEDFLLEIDNQIMSASKILEIDNALQNLNKLDPQLAEIVVYHFFGGYTFAQISEMHGISKNIVIRHWDKAKAYIYAQLH